MDARQRAADTVAADVHEEAAGRVRVRLRGRLDVRSTGEVWEYLEGRLRPLRVSSLEVDVSQLELQGGIGIALLRYLGEGGMTPGAEVQVSGLSEGAQKIMETFTREDYRAYRPHRHRRIPVAEEVGQVVKNLLKDLREEIEFTGAVLKALPSALVRPKQMRWREVKSVMETAGANALPVVVIFSWLVGMIIPLESARPLAQFGAQLFIADMIGFASVRDTGPLVTAIMLAGRSGSAFAAELGTMKVNQELDALKTMGLEPVRFLVIQRIVAAVLLTPLLSLYAMVTSILGGLVVMRFLGFPPLLVWHEMVARVHISDLATGLGKSAIFGVIIGAVGCLRGLQTAEGPRAVGVSTTRSVVASILLIILADTLYSGVQYFFSHP